MIAKRTTVGTRTTLGVVIGPRRGGCARHEIVITGQELERRGIVFHSQQRVEEIVVLQVPVDSLRGTNEKKKHKNYSNVPRF